MPTAEAAAMHRAAVEASASGRPAHAARLLRRALRQIDGQQAPTGTDPVDLSVKVRLSLAFVESELGGTARGLEMLEDVRPHLPTGGDSHLWGLWFGQRGVLRFRAGSSQGALDDLARAVRLLDGEPRELARSLLNRGALLVRCGQLDEAQTELTRCLEVARAEGLTTLAAKSLNNLGHLAYLTGDLPEAFRLFDSSDRTAGPLEPELLAVTAESRTRALLAAGLVLEAREELAAATRWFRRRRLSHDLAEAELGLSTINALLGHPIAARRLAASAAQRFRERGAQGWALVAERYLAQYQLELDPAAGAAAAAELVAPLQEQHLDEDAMLARMVQVQGLVRSGEVARAGRVAADVSWPSSGHRIATRLVAHETRAGLADAAGDVGTAQRWRRQGLALLASHQASFGSVDLKTTASSAGRRLAEDGLAEALRSGQAAGVLEWSERMRATSSRVPPVRPPADAELTALLARLRQLRRQAREQDVAGSASPGDTRAVDELEAAVRRRSWHAQGGTEVLATATVEQVRAALGPDGSLLQLTAVGPRVVAVVVTADRATVRPVGGVRPLRELALRLRSDLDALAAPGLPTGMRDVVRGSLLDGVARLGRRLAPALADARPDGPVQVVPSGVLGGVPWPVLDALAGRPVSVSLSASWWVRAREAGSVTSPGRISALVVAGPDLVSADGEARRVAAVLRDGGARVTTLTGARATAARVLRAADGADVLHVAAHGQHVNDSPLMSSLRLADGQLFGYDLPTLRTPPRHVVLSACDTGRSTHRGGEEALGLTAALLYSGSRSVVAAVARIDDEVAARVAVRFHRGVGAGTAPARALADATRDSDADVPLVCFGAGW